ncbi:hypothetical protein QR680_007846 [Steinernema hermaphroditum]|nr:hypothetical protein QR680_007846 [Steinernema hermaphroditum]
METVSVLLVDHRAELLGRWTLRRIADSFKNRAWERTLQLHRTNRQTVDVYIRRRSDGWDVRLIVDETKGPDEFLVSASEFVQLLECFRSNSVSAHFAVNSKLEGYEIVLDQLASVPFTAPTIYVLNHFCYNFFSKQAMNIQRLYLREVERPEDEKLLSKITTRSNFKSCGVWSSRVLDFAVVKTCVET